MGLKDGESVPVVTKNGLKHRDREYINKKDAIIPLRLTAEEQHIVIKAAKSMNLSRSRFIAEAALTRAKTHLRRKGEM